MPEPLSIDFASPIPLFPLGECVLLPHATVPLHIFEPRYRAMMEDVLDGQGVLAMATFEGDDWKQDYEGRPALREYVCVGRVVRHERLPDGRFNVLVQGVVRARIEREVAEAEGEGEGGGERDYREAVLEPTELHQPLEIDLEEGRARLEALLSDPGLEQLASVAAIRRWLSRDVSSLTMIDLAILTLSNSGEQRYHMLAEHDAEERLAWLERFLKQMRRTVRLADRHGHAKDERGYPLN